MRPVKLTMQAFGSYGKLTQIDFQEPNQNLFSCDRRHRSRKKQLYLMLLYLLFTVKPAPVQTRKMVLYCKASMQS